MKKKSDKTVWWAAGGLVVLVAGLTYLPALFAADCPSKTYGSNNKTLIKYFSSPFCVSCWVQKPIIEKLANESGTQFLLEEYDVDACRGASKPHYIKGVPSFIINDTLLYGVQSEDALKREINFE